MSEGAATVPADTSRGFTLGRAVTFSATLWLCSFLLVLGVGPEAWRPGLEAGVGAAIISGAMGLLLQAVTAGRSLNVILVSRISAFMLRISLVAVGVVATTKILHGEPLAFALAFFPLFFISTAVEHLVTSGAAGGSR